MTLFAQEDGLAFHLTQGPLGPIILTGASAFFLVCAFTVVVVVCSRTVLRWRDQTLVHRERMAMIEAGFHPDDTAAAPAEDAANTDTLSLHKRRG